MTRPALHLAAALLLLPAAVAAGCGGDDEPAKERVDTARTAPRTTTAPATDTVESTDTSTETDTAAAGLPDTCALLSASELRAATGRDVDPQEATGDTPDGFQYRECTWTAVGFEDSAAVRVVSSARRYDTLHRDVGGTGAQLTSLSDLGDAAFFAPGFSGESAGGTRGSTVFVKSGGKFFSLALANAQGQGPQEELVSLMEKMLSRAR